jgi:hypothetical protein
LRWRRAARRKELKEMVEINKSVRDLFVMIKKKKNEIKPNYPRSRGKIRNNR